MGRYCYIVIASDIDRTGNCLSTDVPCWPHSSPWPRAMWAKQLTIQPMHHVGYTAHCGHRGRMPRRATQFTALMCHAAYTAHRGPTQLTAGLHTAHRGLGGGPPGRGGAAGGSRGPGHRVGEAERACPCRGGGWRESKVIVRPSRRVSQHYNFEGREPELVYPTNGVYCPENNGRSEISYMIYTMRVNLND